MEIIPFKIPPMTELLFRAASPWSKGGGVGTGESSEHVLPREEGSEEEDHCHVQEDQQVSLLWGGQWWDDDDDHYSDYGYDDDCDDVHMIMDQWLWLWWYWWW